MLFFTRGDASSTVRSRSGFQMLVLRSGFFWLHLWHSGFEVWKKIPHAETWKDGVVKKALDFHGVSNVCINSVYLYNNSHGGMGWTIIWVLFVWMENNFWWFLLPGNGLIQQRQENSHPGVGFVHRCRFHRQDWSKTWRKILFLAAWISCFVFVISADSSPSKIAMFVWNTFRNFSEKPWWMSPCRKNLRLVRWNCFVLLRWFFSAWWKNPGVEPVHLKDSSKRNKLPHSVKGGRCTTQPQECTPLPCSHHHRIVPLSLILLQLVVCALYQIGPRDPKGVGWVVGNFQLGSCSP